MKTKMKNKQLSEEETNQKGQIRKIRMKMMMSGKTTKKNVETKKYKH